MSANSRFAVLPYVSLQPVEESLSRACLQRGHNLRQPFARLLGELSPCSTQKCRQESFGGDWMPFENTITLRQSLGAAFAIGHLAEMPASLSGRWASSLWPNLCLISVQVTLKELLVIIRAAGSRGNVTVKDTNFPHNMFEWKPLNPILHGHI